MDNRELQAIGEPVAAALHEKLGPDSTVYLIIVDHANPLNPYSCSLRSRQDKLLVVHVLGHAIEFSMKAIVDNTPPGREG